MSTETKTVSLWRLFIEQMDTEGRVNFGAFFTIAEIEGFLNDTYGRVSFGSKIDHIRKALRRRGMVFTERGQFGSGFIIAQVEKNEGELDRLTKCSRNSMREAVVLGTKTPVALMKAEQRARFESKTAKAATRLALISRRIST